ncbi:MAG: hypothetical protein ACXW00_03000 [Methylobacter sp.]
MKSRTTFTGLTRVFILRAHYKKGAIVIEYLDDEGLLRVWHDENYQLIDGGVLSDDVALLMDVWGMELACKMIVLGYNLDIKKTIEYELKHCEPKSTGNDKAIVLSEIMNRIFTLAKSAIAGGVIKEHDTPANWIAWAQTKGYNTDHLNPSIQIKAFQDSIHRSKNAGCIESYSEQLKQWQSPYLTVHTETICVTSNATAEAVTDTTQPANDDHNETLADLFDPVTVETLAKMFPTDKLYTTEQWKKWAERAQRCGLVAAREGRNMFNPYKAGMWFLTQGKEGWDNERLYRTLARNLPVRSRDEKWQLTGEMD